MKHSATFKCAKIVIHPLQPSCDAQDTAIYWQVDQKGYTSQKLLRYAGPFQISFVCIPLTHDLLSYDLIHPNMFPQVVQPIKMAAPYNKHPQKLC